ncbi:Hsp20/alpha crystallin family protein [Salinibaculum rarum]|uniref:Hsp20/alpha crystallin family protein n=1 Tax=Salinibaculum rarum TaxID=3058903 RepID=UPI00265EAB9F|nr:Hsp20/alpha crystallin family protein [Salinibaculum sp. KK48]
MIRELGETIGDAVVESVGRAVARSQEQMPLDADLLESDDAYLALFDAPGVESGDVQVRFEDGTVIVRVDRFRDFHDGYEMRFPGRGLSLDGRVDLPDDATVDVSGATATLKENGTLQVEIPKVEAGDVANEQTDAEDDDAEATGDDTADAADEN